MSSTKKTIRYYYWVLIEFIKKNVKLIILTFIVSFVLVVALVSLSPYLENIFFVRKQTIGLAGKYNVKDLPTEITNKVSNGLVFVKQDGSIIPALASTWEIRNNGKEFLVHLKQNLIWNNGSKFSAENIDYNFTDVTKTVKDDNTIIFTLKNSLPVFISYLNKPLIKSPLVGVGGLYKTTKITFKNNVVKEVYLSPNKKGIPFLTYKFYDNEDQLILAYKKGEISEFSTSKKNLIESFYTWKNTNVSTTTDYTRLLTIFFNFKNQLLEDRNVRTAIRMGIDANLIKDYGQIANNPIPPTSWAYSAKTKPVVYDLDTAKKIVTNSLTSTQSGQLNLVTYYEYSDISDVVIDQLQKLSLKINLNYLTQNPGNNYDLFLAYWKIPEDPDQYYFWHSAQTNSNIGSYKNLKIDKLLEDGRSTFNVADRTKIYQEFQKTITEDPPAIFLYYPYVYTVKRK